jgi:hypothetical protein
MLCRALVLVVLLVVSLSGAIPIRGEIVSWHFENGNDHGFNLWSVTPAADDPATARPVLACPRPRRVRSGCS